jgi:hypothetical protein
MPLKVQDELMQLLECSKYWIYDQKLKHRIHAESIKTQMDVIRTVKESIAEHIVSKMGDIDFCFLKEYVRAYPRLISYSEIELDSHIVDEYILFILEEDPESGDHHERLFHLKKDTSSSEFPQIIRRCEVDCTIKDFFIEEFRQIIEEGKIDPTKLTDERRQKIREQRAIIQSREFRG